MLHNLNGRPPVWMNEGFGSPTSTGVALDGDNKALPSRLAFDKWGVCGYMLLLEGA